MTSTLFTASSASAAVRVSTIEVIAASLNQAYASGIRLAFLRAVARGDLLLAGVLGGAILDHLSHQRAITGHVVGELREFRAVPLLELDHARPFVVETARLHGREQSGCTELLQARLVEVDVLEAPAHLLRCHALALAVLVLR